VTLTEAQIRELYDSASALRSASDAYLFTIDAALSSSENVEALRLTVKKREEALSSAKTEAFRVLLTLFPREATASRQRALIRATHLRRVIESCLDEIERGDTPPQEALRAVGNMLSGAVSRDGAQ